MDKRKREEKKVSKRPTKRFGAESNTSRIFHVPKDQ